MLYDHTTLSQSDCFSHEQDSMRINTASRSNSIRGHVSSGPLQVWDAPLKVTPEYTSAQGSNLSLIAHTARTDQAAHFTITASLFRASTMTYAAAPVLPMNYHFTLAGPHAQANNYIDDFSSMPIANTLYIGKNPVTTQPLLCSSAAWPEFSLPSQASPGRFRPVPFADVTSSLSSQRARPFRLPLSASQVD